MVAERRSNFMEYGLVPQVEFPYSLETMDIEDKTRKVMYTIRNVKIHPKDTPDIVAYADKYDIVLYPGADYKRDIRFYMLADLKIQNNGTTQFDPYHIDWTKKSTAKVLSDLKGGEAFKWRLTINGESKDFLQPVQNRNLEDSISYFLHGETGTNRINDPKINVKEYKRDIIFTYTLIPGQSIEGKQWFAAFSSSPKLDISDIWLREGSWTGINGKTLATKEVTPYCFENRSIGFSS